MEPFHGSLCFSKAALGEFNPTSEGRTGHCDKKQQLEAKCGLQSDTSTGFLVYSRFYLKVKEKGKSIHKSSVTKNRYIFNI